MDLKRCLFAGLLALGGVGTAAAMDAATQDPTASHGSIDSVCHDGSAGTHDAPGPSRDHTLPSQTDDGSDAGDAGNGGSAPHPHASQRASLGWQSLLPGSIQ